MTDGHENAARFIKAFNAHDEDAMRVLTHPNARFAAMRTLATASV
jgi:hypothetical protein